MKRFIFLSILFMICMVSQAQILKPKKTEIALQKKFIHVARIDRTIPQKPVPLKKKLVTTRISLQASELKQRK